MKNNLPSLFTFLALVSIFGILSSFISRKQIDRIANQNIKLQENEEQLRLMIIRDPMTGLYNRLYINEIERSNVIGTRFAVFMFDIDKLKYVNDNFGHLEGDKLIISAAAILKDSFRETDIVARIGGDEFLAIVSDCDSTMAEMFIDIINKTIADNNMNTSTPRLRISISVGFSIIKNDDDTMEILMQKADELMYADKTRKRSITDN
jgi:diguanylate cyclase (GGDEF)-like protein